MSLLFMMLPVYIGGNLHCLGMCGPLVAMLGQSRYRLFYFFGRTISFTLAATLAAGLGETISFLLKPFYVPAALSVGFGLGLLVMGWKIFKGESIGSKKLASLLEPANRKISLLLLREGALPVFIFGLLTAALPCGQTLLVFSACAVSADLWTGFLNGLVFALFTSPSLLLALSLRSFLAKGRFYYQALLGISSILVGCLSVCRGLAELDLIPHWVLNREYHIVIF